MRCQPEPTQRPWRTTTAPTGGLGRVLPAPLAASLRASRIPWETREAFHLLGLQAGAPLDEVRSAYRRLAKEYHPDVIASRGLSGEFEDFAKEKMRAVNDAYDQIKEARGTR